jgi:hypothetical protein
LHSNSNQEDISHQLADLKDQITLTSSLVLQQQQSGLTSNSDLAQDASRITSYLNKLTHAAQSLHSSASTVIEGDRTTVWGGSILGEQLSTEQYQDIRNWIPPPIEEPLKGIRHHADGINSTLTLPTEQPVDSGPNSDSYTTRVDSDSDSDPEDGLVAMFEQRGLALLRGDEFVDAEKYLSQAINLRNRTSSRSKISIEHLQANLAIAYCYQAKWDEADRLLYPLSDSRNKLELLALHCLHAVSVSNYHLRGDLDIADRTCRKALTGKKKLLGKTHSSYYETVKLLGEICVAKGNTLEAEGWWQFLPEDWHKKYPAISALDYLEKHWKRPGSSSPAAQTSPSPILSLTQTVDTFVIEHEPESMETPTELALNSMIPQTTGLDQYDQLPVRRKPLNPPEREEEKPVASNQELWSQASTTNYSGPSSISDENPAICHIIAYVCQWCII